jgi:hypothetical protein
MCILEMLSVCCDLLNYSLSSGLFHTPRLSNPKFITLGHYSSMPVEALAAAPIVIGVIQGVYAKCVHSAPKHAF